MRNHKDLNVWKSSIQLAKQVYHATDEFPKEETYGLVSQMRRAAVSIASNIAEGAARRGTREFIRFLNMAAGSASELDTQLTISAEIALTAPEKITELQEATNSVSRQLQGLIRHLEHRTKTTGQNY